MNRCYQQSHKPGALFLLGYFYLNGFNGEQRFEKAIEFFNKAIILGHPAAMQNRALMYEEGIGGLGDYNKAILLYDEAIEKGNPNAMTNRAVMYMQAEESTNYAKAIELFTKAASFGDTLAMNALVNTYLQGLGTPKNMAKALFYAEEFFRENETIEDEISTFPIEEAISSGLLELLWPKLIQGLFFSDHTMLGLKAHCQNDIINKIENEPIGSSLAFLTDNKHPLFHILDKDKISSLPSIHHLIIVRYIMLNQMPTLSLEL